MRDATRLFRFEAPRGARCAAMPLFRFSDLFRYPPIAIDCRLMRGMRGGALMAARAYAPMRWIRAAFCRCYADSSRFCRRACAVFRLFH
jgi:hypothetical protein